MSRKKSDSRGKNSGVVYDITPLLEKKVEGKRKEQPSQGRALSNIAWLMQHEIPKLFYRLRFLRELAERRRAASRVHVMLMHFKHPITTDDALDEMSMRGCRPATTMEFNAFREKSKYVDIQFPVAVIGIDPDVPGDEFVSSCFVNGVATIDHRQRTWGTNVRFAVVQMK